MKAFTDHHEAEINEMLQEYWTMRKQAGEWRLPFRSTVKVTWLNHTQRIT